MSSITTGNYCPSNKSLFTCTSHRQQLQQQQQQQQQTNSGKSAVLYYRDVCGNKVTLVETRHGCRKAAGGDDSGATSSTTTTTTSGAIEYVLRLESRRGYAGTDLALLCIGLAFWTAYGSPVYALIGLFGLALAFRSALLTDRTNTLLLVESVGVQITNKKTIFGALEEYLPWSSIKDIFINEVICEQKVLYYLTFIVKELTSNGEEQIRLIPLFCDLKPERRCLEYINKTNFAHSKELMKIIRRVIKWQPKQGQHFSSRNLFVTYNHVPWTRHDKSFAVMKFCDRPEATAFPHAFILTVKVLDNEQKPLADEMGAKSTKSESDKTANTFSTGNEHESNPMTCENITKDQNEKEEGTVNVQQDMENGNRDEISRSLRSRSRHKMPGSPITTNSTRSSASCDEEKESNESTEDVTSNNSNEEVYRSSNNSCTNYSISENEVCETTEAHAEITLPQTLNKSSLFQIENENSNSSNSSNSSKDSQSDSASLPYQYLIERDIERELENSRLTQSKKRKKEELEVAFKRSSTPIDLPNNNSPVNDVFDSNKDFNKSPSSSRKSFKFRSRQNSKDSDTSPPPEVANLRSSDITDLVMKGRMFTIRQDKDTVTVVEQKTKLELDEVLENSEKVETKEGDPCLLNSSLLGLEKMVTRIQQPSSLPEDKLNNENPLVSYVDLVHNNNREMEADVAEKNLMDQHQSISSFETANCWSDFLANENMTDSSFDKIDKVLNDTNMYINNESSEDDIDLRMECEPEDEDIVPEAYSTFLNGTLGSSKLLPEVDVQDLLMDDDFGLNNINASESGEIKTEALSNDFCSKDSCKVPKIISDEVITNEQLPETLLKVIQNKFVSQKPYSDANNIINKSETDYVNNKIIVENVEDKMETEEISENIKICTNQLQSDKSTATFDNESDNLINQKVKNKSDMDRSAEYGLLVNDRGKSQESTSFEVTPRITRSSSKSQGFGDPAIFSESNEKSSKSERYSETRSHKILERNTKSQKNVSLETKIVQQKRKNSVSEKAVAKIQKSEYTSNTVQKDVMINVRKLMKDLKYGVKVVVERLDVKNISKK